MSIPDLGRRYAVLRELGRGGMGRVFLVRDTHLGRNLALKLLDRSPSDPGEVKRFQDEFALLAKIEHPGIARVFDFGYLAGRPFFTSEHIAGPPLSRRARVPADQVLHWAMDIAGALAFLHQNGVLHLDVKPSNVIAGPPPARAVLVDFGLFRRGGSVPTGRRVEGSLPYLAPEQMGKGPLGAWTDIYQFGVTIFRLLSGRYPRPPRSSGDLRSGGGDWEPLPAPLDGLPPVLAREVEALLTRCLALDPHSRFTCGAELLAALQTVLGEHPDGQRIQPAAAITLGRERELAAADGFLDALQRLGQRASALLVTGEPGLGQTHFLREIKVRSQIRGLPCYLETLYPGRPISPGRLLEPLLGHVDREIAPRFRSFLERLSRPRWGLYGDSRERDRRQHRAAQVILAARSISHPVVLAIDRLELSDEVSLEILLDLTRFLGDEDCSRRPPLGLVLGYREEGPSRDLLRELTGNLLDRGCSAISMNPLGPRESRELYRFQAGVSADGVPPGLSVFQETGGSPSRIAAAAKSGSGGPPGPPATGDDLPGEPLPLPRSPAGRLLLTLVLLRRPASAREIRRMAGVGRGVERLLEQLRSQGLALEVGAGSAGRGWLPAPPASRLAESAPVPVKKEIHSHIAEELVQDASQDDGTRLAEALHHFVASGRKGRVFRYGALAARYLKATFQYRAALDAFRSALEAAPPGQEAARREMALEVAELDARIGNLEEGIRTLKELLHRSPRLPGTFRRRALLRLGTLHSRRGDFQRADVLLRKGLGKRRKDREALGREEVLYFLNEHAAMKAFLGDYREALSLCDEALLLSRSARTSRLRELGLSIHATRANVFLRLFEYERAIAGFQKALEIAESLGSPENQAPILNNLGIAFSQYDRLPEALRTFGEAKEVCLRLGEAASLASVSSNLAILHAKLGQFDAAEKELTQAETLSPSAIGRRQEFFLKHARGMCELHAGRYARAEPSFRTAIQLGREVGDVHLTRFDEVFLAESLIFLAAYATADRELLHLSGPENPDGIRRAALARRAFLAGMTGQSELVAESRAARDRLSVTRPVPFLEAWDNLFLGWAFSLAGLSQEAFRLLDPAREYFGRQRLRPAAALADCVRGEAFLLAGDPESGMRLMECPEPVQRGLARTLAPLLGARLLLRRGAGPADRARSADLLARAGSFLLGNPLPEWSLRLEGLRALLRDPAGPPPRWDEKRTAIARGLPEKARRGYLESHHWKAWTEAPDLPAAPGRQRGRRPASPGAAERRPITRTLPLHRDPGSEPEVPRARLVAKSPAMRSLRSILDRIRTTELNVLISGEIGVGKELVARLIHDESPRARCPFQVVDFAAIPAGLVEAELFGAREGAFTGQIGERRGLLAQASGGTVYLDEIAGASLEVQGKLLRVLSQRSIRPLGADVETPIDVRFLFSSSTDLEVEAREKRFRSDLLHRIQVITVRVPPLRERREDFPELVRLLLEEFPGPPPVISRKAVERLGELAWPGNARQLRNFLAQLRIEENGQISQEAIDRRSAQASFKSLFPAQLLESERLSALRERLDREYFVHHFRRLEGDAGATCRFLGLNLQQLYRRCARLGLSLRSERRRHGLPETRRRRD